MGHNGASVSSPSICRCSEPPQTPLPGRATYELFLWTFPLDQLIVHESNISVSQADASRRSPIIGSPSSITPTVILVSNTLFAPQSVATNTSSSSALESSEAPRSNGMRSRLLPEADARSLAYRNSSTLHWSRPFLRRRPQDKLNRREPP